MSQAHGDACTSAQCMHERASSASPRVVSASPRRPSSKAASSGDARPAAPSAGVRCAHKHVRTRAASTQQTLRRAVAVFALSCSSSFSL
eukprot:4466863-Pleurochrysis_carterae.AAC.6